MYTTGAARFLKHQTHTETHAQDTNLENGIHSYDQLIKVWNLSCQEMFSDFLAISWGENKPYHLRCIIYVLPKETYLWKNYNKYISKYYTMITTPINIFIHIYLYLLYPFIFLRCCGTCTWTPVSLLAHGCSQAKYLLLPWCRTRWQQSW